MKRLHKILLLLVVLVGLIAFWYWADNVDYFKADYRDLSVTQQDIFKWQDGDGGAKLMERYRKAFADSQYVFPGQKVTKIKLFRNIRMTSGLTSKTLKQDEVGHFIRFCNDTSNFHWGETTWKQSESDYFCRLYGPDDKVVGKIYFCLDNCGMTRAIPFTPMMKFGGLSARGMEYIQRLIADQSKWE